ncbi:MAG: UDP-N-acetylmuramoyl-L-alanyl-D-glutamate--2,6-diaminopimelate ligase [Pseudomonadota bacterium]
MRLLSELLTQAKLDATVQGDAAVTITAMTTDSRQVTPGGLFAAMPGVSADGAQYIAEAVRRGASAILLANDAVCEAAVPLVRVADMRAAVSALAAAFYAAQPAFAFAITGTDGKTSTADFVRQLGNLLGHQAASLGTLGLRSPVAALDAAFPAMNTSPEPVLLHQTLRALSEAGVDMVAIETSSHGLDQKRPDGVRFCAGAFTNMTRDHLDYHGSLDAYFTAKARLFSAVLPEGATAVLNHDDAHYDTLRRICDARRMVVVSFGAHADATYRVLSVTPHAGGLDAQLDIRGVHYTLKLPLYGAFQLSNMLSAMGLLSAMGVKEAAVMALLPQLRGVPGRLEKIASHNDAPVFIDYAHTPAALENILKTLRPHTQKKLHVVFGCGGDRDAGKRPEMGAAAVAYADAVIVTDDNPRSENPAAIRAAILARASGATEIGDRDEAIRAAVKNLQAGDVLVVAGKGHETTQTIGKHVLPFNDADHIRKAVAA